MDNYARGREAPEPEFFAFSELKMSDLCTFGRNFLENLSDYALNFIAVRISGDPGARYRAPDGMQGQNPCRGFGGGAP